MQLCAQVGTNTKAVFMQLAAQAAPLRYERTAAAGNNEGSFIVF